MAKKTKSDTETVTVATEDVKVKWVDGKTASQMIRRDANALNRMYTHEQIQAFVKSGQLK